MKKLMLFACLGILTGAIGGCASGSSAATDDATMRKKLSKNKIDINDVPEKQRPMVQGFIDRANQMRAKGQAHAGGQ